VIDDDERGAVRLGQGQLVVEGGLELPSVGEPGEIVGDREMSSLVVDLSSEGARLERPFMAPGHLDSGPIELGPAGKSRAFIENSLKQDAGRVEARRLAGVQTVDREDYLAGSALRTASASLRMASTFSAPNFSRALA